MPLSCTRSVPKLEHTAHALCDGNHAAAHPYGRGGTPPPATSCCHLQWMDCHTFCLPEFQAHEAVSHKQEHYHTDGCWPVPHADPAITTAAHKAALPLGRPLQDAMQHNHRYRVQSMARQHGHITARLQTTQALQAAGRQPASGRQQQPKSNCQLISRLQQAASNMQQ